MTAFLQDTDEYGHKVDYNSRHNPDKDENISAWLYDINQALAISMSTLEIL